MARSFRDARLADMRPIRWLGELAEKMAAVFGEAQDTEVQLLKEGVSMRVPTHAPDDVLGILATNFQLPVFSQETPARLRARMIEAFSTWEEAGLPQSIIRSLSAWGLAGNVQVINWSEWPTPDNWFSKFWVILGPITPYGQQLWGAFNWGDGTWGTNATPAEIREILGQIVFWKSPQSLPVAAINVFGFGSVWGMFEWGAADWGGAETVAWPLTNMWGDPWVVWGAFNWGNGKWLNGEMTL